MVVFIFSEWSQFLFYFLSLLMMHHLLFRLIDWGFRHQEFKSRLQVVEKLVYSYKVFYRWLFMNSSCWSSLYYYHKSWYHPLNYMYKTWSSMWSVKYSSAVNCCFDKIIKVKFLIIELKWTYASPFPLISTVMRTLFQSLDMLAHSLFCLWKSTWHYNESNYLRGGL